MAVSRWVVLRTLATAVRTATRPGSAGLAERLVALPRLVRATVRGEYPGTSTGRLLALAAALGYLVSPVDLVPEAFLALLGLADDALVLSWLAASLVNETEAFLAWERVRGRGDGRRDGPPAGEQTVPGDVVG